MTTTNSATTINSKKPSTKQELIAANIKLLIEQLEAGQSDALTNYLTAMSRLHSYSFGNVLEIARQMPAATRVAGFWTWKNLGRSVKAGQKGIRILAPIVGVRRKKDEEANKDITKQNERILLGFRNAYVFDISQTDGVDLPEMREVSGDPGENIDRLAAFLHSKGIQLVYNEKIAPALGMSYGGRIALLPGQSKAETFATLVHETAHELLHKSDRRTATTKTVRETEAEAVAFVVGKAVGLVTGSASADYKVCANPSCPVHHPKQQASSNDEKWKAEQEKQRKEQAIVNATGLRVLAAIGSAVPVRLLKRDLLFILEKLVSVMDESRVEMLARQHGIRQMRDDGGVAKTLAAFLRRSDEGTLSRMLVETSILLAATRGNPSAVLKDAATAYKVDTDAITAKVKQEFAAKEKARKTAQPAPKAARKVA